MAGGETTFLKVKNRAYSKLAAAINASTNTWTLTAGQGARFPSTYPFDVTCEDEIARCTNRATDTLTVTRAQQSTSAAAHPNKAYVALNITAKSITDLNTAVNFIEKYADYGMAFYGIVTTATDTQHFKISGLSGLGTGWFKPAAGAPYEIFVVQADGAAPEGESQPVVAYTSSDGTFQHAVFSAQLAVGDEVLILIPMIASLGTKATAAASGAVSTTDYAIAYIKQILNELLGTDGAWTNLSNASVASLDVALQAMGRVLAIDGSNQFSGSLDGAARTTLEAMWVALGVLLGTKSDSIPAMTAAPGTLAVLPLLKAILERIGVTPADSDDSLHTIVGQRDGAIPAMNAAIDNASTLAMNIRAIMERLGATPADSDDPVHTALGQRDATATGDSLSDIASTDAHAKLRRLLLRFSSDAFTVDMDGSARTTIEAMMSAISDVFTASGAAFTVSLDGSPRTDLAALYTALGALLGTKATAAATGGVGSGTAMMGYIKQIVTLLRDGTYGLSAIKAYLTGPIYGNIQSVLVDYLNHATHGLAPIRAAVYLVETEVHLIWGDIRSILGDYLTNVTFGLAAIRTAITGVNTQVLLAQKRSGGLAYWGTITAINGNAFTSTDLAGLGIDSMHGWTVYVFQADDAAPEGEYRGMTDYTNEGVVSHNAFSVALEVGDRVVLIHSMLYGTYAATAGSGPRSLETLGEEQDAELDVARGTSGAVTVDDGGDEDDLYDESADTEFVLLELRVDLHNMVEGDTITFRVYTTEDGTERLISDDDANTFTGPQTKPRVEIVGSTNQVWGREGIRICAVKISGGNRDVTAYWRDAKRGS